MKLTIVKRLALSLLVHGPVLKCLLMSGNNDSVAVGAAAETSFLFSYDPNSPRGPSHWGDTDTIIDDNTNTNTNTITNTNNNNQCGGDKNSPIALQTSPCSTNGDYKSTVRCDKLLLVLPVYLYIHTCTYLLYR